MPRRDAPVGRRSQDGVVVKAREFGPQELLPKVRIDGDRKAQRGDKRAEEARDELSQGELRRGEEEERRRGEEDGQFGAEDGRREDEEADGLPPADSRLLGVTTRHAALKPPSTALTANCACRNPASATSGWLNPARSTGPTNVRGTAPGKAKWSYVEESRARTSLVGVP
ncbi:hypothetical protein Trco_006402 [Trichoderma cornu-damae]|uniref:Uncharacterized protein n=1 Tax=Trichoderma cornu-damae TaxID=654480 RepID=A0A9P8QKC9_9HYPO|nr:hypothetical protein Trco_006402 [Trichoderma cornu-damae]